MWWGGLGGVVGQGWWGGQISTCTEGQSVRGQRVCGGAGSTHAQRGRWQVQGVRRQTHLHDVDGVHVGVAHLDEAAQQDRVVAEPRVPRHRQHRADGVQVPPPQLLAQRPLLQAGGPGDWQQNEARS